MQCFEAIRNWTDAGRRNSSKVEFHPFSGWETFVWWKTHALWEIVPFQQVHGIKRISYIYDQLFRDPSSWHSFRPFCFIRLFFISSPHSTVVVFVRLSSVLSPFLLVFTFLFHRGICKLATLFCLGVAGPGGISKRSTRKMRIATETLTKREGKEDTKGNTWKKGRESHGRNGERWWSKIGKWRRPHM